MRRGAMLLALDTVLRKISLGTVAVGATAALAFPVWSHFRADSFSRQGDQVSLERALQYTPDDASLHNRLGRVLLNQPLGDSGRAIKELSRATELDPRTGQFWVDLSVARELEPDISGAAEALNRARLAEPRTPTILWYLANFELRRGEKEQSIAVLRDLLAQSPEYTSRALPVFARAADLQTLVNLAIPPRADSLAAVMDYIRREERVADVPHIWKRVVELGQPVNQWDINVFQDWLLFSNHGRLASEVWRQAAERGWIPVDRVAMKQPFYNSDFSRPMLNHGFDWRVLQHPEAYVWIGDRGPHPGQQAMCVRFSDTARLDYNHLLHFVSVEPEHNYALSAWIRTEQLNSGVGVILQLSEGQGASATIVKSDPLGGTHPWSEIRLPFRTGANAELARLTLIRPAPAASDAPASGVACIAGVEWKNYGPLSESGRGKTP